jgi:hypothetical protein
MYSWQPATREFRMLNYADPRGIMAGQVEDTGMSGAHRWTAYDLTKDSHSGPRKIGEYSDLTDAQAAVERAVRDGEQPPRATGAAL